MANFDSFKIEGVVGLVMNHLHWGIVNRGRQLEEKWKKVKWRSNRSNGGHINVNKRSKGQMEVE